MLELPSDGTQVKAMCLPSIEYDRDAYQVRGALHTVSSPFGSPDNCWVGDLPVDPETVESVKDEPTGNDNPNHDPTTGEFTSGISVGDAVKWNGKKWEVTEVHGQEAGTIRVKAKDGTERNVNAMIVDKVDKGSTKTTQPPIKSKQPKVAVEKIERTKQIDDASATESGGIAHHGNSAPAWQQNVEKGLANVSVGLRNKVGASVETHEKIFDALGVPNTSLWRSASGGYDRTTNKVVIPYMREVFSKQDVNNGADKVVKHEYGHAVDNACRKLLGQAGSDSQEFQEAYQAERKVYLKDRDKVDPNTGANLPKMTYFLHEESGPREFFAEGFAHLHGGSPAMGGERFFARFPKTLEAMRRIIKEVEDA